MGLAVAERPRGSCAQRLLQRLVCVGRRQQGSLPAEELLYGPAAAAQEGSWSLAMMLCHSFADQFADPKSVVSREQPLVQHVLPASPAWT